MRIRTYEALLRLYPPAFRTKYGSEMRLTFDELLDEHGRAEAWRRALTDVLVTVPPLRMEPLMQSPASHLLLPVLLTVGAIASVAFVMAGALAGAIAAIAALVVATLMSWQRTKVIQGLQPGPSSRSRRRVATASGIVFIVAVASYLYDIGDGAISGTSLTAHNVVGMTSMIVAIASLARRSNLDDANRDART